MDKELDGRGGEWYRIPDITDSKDERIMEQWLLPFRRARIYTPEFYTELMRRLLVEDYIYLFDCYNKRTKENTELSEQNSKLRRLNNL